ncbi:MAG: diguanylate cyclase, partial [Gammaproteobacteria bacterium]|nr:diguanylate cyclase [Gammaproteobacteria bacterium]
DNVYSEIERDLLRSILISSLMASDTFVRDWVKAGEQDPEAIVRYLREIQQKYRTTTAFFVSEATRNYYHPTGVIKQVESDEPADSWYFRARGLNDNYEINIDHDTADRSRLSIFINYRVVDSDGRFLGLTGIGLAVEQVVELIESYERRYSREIYFVDRDGAVTLTSEDDGAHPDLQDRAGLDKFATRILANPSTSLAYENEAGETVFVNSRLVPEFGWYLIVEQSKTEAEGQLLRTLGFNIVLALAIIGLVLGLVYMMLNRYQQSLEQMATTDKLTGAANRHVFHMLFSQVVGTARRRNEPVALMCIDLDGFKPINDRYGHQAGDGVLRQFTGVVHSIIRASDTLCRWGGDEFLLLMADCNARQASQVAEKIRTAVDERTFSFKGRTVSITVSIGVTEVAMEDAMDSAVARADQALYHAKQAGRNRIASL